jgi:hypothetical protein
MEKSVYRAWSSWATRHLLLRTPLLLLLLIAGAVVADARPLVHAW